MTRSTNMEHVEVLQRMANESWRGSPEHAALDAAIASLSAQQPPADTTVCTGDAIRCHDGHGCECAMRGQPPAEAQAQGDAGCGACSDGCVASGTCRVRDETPPSAPVGVELLCQVYSDAYHHGHHATVEGGYIDVLPVDRDTFWREQVEENYTEALAQQPAAVDALKAIRAYTHGDSDERMQELHRIAGRGLAGQQPAAVDDAMVERACEALAARWRGDRYLGVAETEDVRAVLTAALELQQGGRSDD